MNISTAAHTDLTIRLIHGGWVIEKQLHRMPGVYASMATAMLARGLSDADKNLLQCAASGSPLGTGTIQYQAVWGVLNGTDNPRLLKLVAERRKRIDLDLSEDSEGQSSPAAARSGSRRRWCL